MTVTPITPLRNGNPGIVPPWLQVMPPDHGVIPLPGPVPPLPGPIVPTPPNEGPGWGLETYDPAAFIPDDQYDGMGVGANLYDPNDPGLVPDDPNTPVIMTQ